MGNTENGRGSDRVSVWSRSITVGWLLAIGFVSAPAFIAAAVLVEGRRSLFLGLLIASAAFLALGSVRVSVTARGVTVTSLLFPFLRRRIALGKISRASAQWARPSELGGWGYRWMPGRSAVSLREGDALWLDLVTKKQFVITVDDADNAARLVNEYLAGSSGKGH
ncbi:MULTISPECIES: hypothetical protein [unclassified Streptomyces]|uniref:hypothetical protein n=1 Tax=unclassified Streptomyces TaxID=2593676 RepID=UPI003809DF14